MGASQSKSLTPSSDTVSPTYPALPKKPTNLMDLPAEIIDVILGYVCSNWAVRIEQIRPYPLYPDVLFVRPHNESSESGGFALATLAKTNKLLHEHLKWCLHKPESFSGYTQLVGVDLQRLLKPKGFFMVQVHDSIRAFWPQISDMEFLNWVLRTTMVLEMNLKSWERQSRRVQIPTVFPSMTRLMLVNGLTSIVAKKRVRQNQAEMLDKMSKVNWVVFKKGTEDLLLNGVGITLRFCKVHAEFTSHPMILSNDLGPFQPPSPPALRARVDSLCCPNSRLDDPTLKFICADLLATGLGSKPVDGRDSQTCEICRQWRLINTVSGGEQKISDDREGKEETEVGEMSGSS